MKEEELTTGDGMSLYIITFDHSSASDLDPKKLSHLRKYLLTTLVSFTSFTRILISTLPAPALPEMAATLSLSPVEAAMSMTIYLLATALGPLLISPLSELYGRSIILHTTNVWFLAWNLACGLAPSKGVLLTARFFAGFGAAAAYAVGTGVLGDIWTTEQRGKSLSYYSVIPMIGAAMGPIVGGAMADHLSWRWIFFATSMFQAVLVVLFILCFQETYGPTILACQAARMRRVQGDERYTTAHEVQYRENTSSSPNSGLKSRRDVLLKSKYVLHALGRPLRLLFFHPVVQICGMSMAIGYGTLYVILTSLAGLFTDVYDASATASGLHYLAAALGEMVAAQVCGPLMDWLYSRQKNRWQAARSSSGLGSGDVPEVPPEEIRMPLAVWASLVPCAGLLLYGWSAAYKVHWAVVDVGVFLTALGLQMAGMPRVAYLVDTYPAHVSSAIAATQFMSSLSAFLFPLFTPALYGHLGYGFGNTLVAGVVVLVSVPSAYVLWKFGQNLRSRKSSF